MNILSVVRPLDSYGAVLVFGGSIHPDQEARHEWMKDELGRRLCAFLVAAAQFAVHAA